MNPNPELVLADDGCPNVDPPEEPRFSILSSWQWHRGVRKDIVDLTPKSVPWSLVAGHEAQAKKNHCGQSLEGLSRRGGLSPNELYVVVYDCDYYNATYEARVKEQDACLWLIGLYWSTGMKAKLALEIVQGAVNALKGAGRPGPYRVLVPPDIAVQLEWREDVVGKTLKQEFLSIGDVKEVIPHEGSGIIVQPINKVA